MAFSNMVMAIHVGSRFESFKFLENAVKELEKEQNVTFWKRKARTINSMSCRIVRLNPENLRYYSIKYACIFGGRIHKKELLPLF